MHRRSFTWNQPHFSQRKSNCNFVLILLVGKFKGKASEIDLSLDDLVELLHSVDHHKVVDSGNAVITDQQLEALLDRTLTSQENKTSDKGTECTKSSLPVADDQSIFRVIEERDAKGNVIRDGDDSAPTTDAWHIIVDRCCEPTEGNKDSSIDMTNTMSGGDGQAGDDRVVAVELGASADQVSSSACGQNQIDSSEIRCDQFESNTDGDTKQVNSNAGTAEQSNVGGTQCDSNYHNLGLCGNSNTHHLIEEDCINNVGNSETLPTTSGFCQNDIPTVPKAVICLGEQQSSKQETMTQDCSIGLTSFESNDHTISKKSNASPIELAMSEA